MRYYLAIDIGASSGRHILGHMENGKILLEEIHRFPNGMINKGSELCWDINALFSEIMTGMKKCTALKKIPVSVGVETWGVDFILLDKAGNVLGNTVAYRDGRTDGMDMEVYKHVPENELYARTGIQKQSFNTIFQLMALKTKSPRLLEQADSLLLVPDYLHGLLCGVRKTEYTNATTTGLVNATGKDWDGDIISRCGYPRGIFQEIVPAGTVLGTLTEAVIKEVGFDCYVVLPPTHDTASAFLAVPAMSNASVYISSGTWSLMGVERSEPITTAASRIANFTNEGGYEYRFRYLKNIMGLWMIQSVRRELGGSLSFPEIAEMAKASDYQGVIDVDANRFLAPASMMDAVKEACREKGQPPPESGGDILNCIYRSLALSYARTIKELEELTGKRYTSINIIGGGSQDGYLNELTARACSLPVYTGPVEGTALGNIVSQMIKAGDLSGVEAARDGIRNSFEIKEVLF